LVRILGLVIVSAAKHLGVKRDDGRAGHVTAGQHCQWAVEEGGGGADATEVETGRAKLQESDEVMVVVVVMMVMMVMMMVMVVVVLVVSAAACHRVAGEACGCRPSPAEACLSS
jgi:hypothetical protein